MSRVGILAVTSLMVLGGCSVPSLEELEAERGVPITVNYTSTFKTGCIVMRTQDEANAANFTAQTVDGSALATNAPPLRLRALRGGDWGTKLRVTIVAHERTCTGKEVDRAELSVDSSGERGKEPLAVTLNTPDEDGDGWVATLGNGKGGTDCDDSDAVRSPSTQEICDDKDNNCVDGTDENLPMVSMFRDVDGDGVGGEAIQHCMPATGVSGYTAIGGDCDDRNSNNTPGKTETCDNADNNCNNVVDEGHDRNWYLDNDADGVPQGPTVIVQCGSPGPKYMKYPSGPPFDCDDTNDRRAPNRPELCDEIDNNCASNNGVEIDENFPTKGSSCAQGCGTLQCSQDGASLQCSASEPGIYYLDRDGDGDGLATEIPGLNPLAVCQGRQSPSGYVLNQGSDCDDADPAASSLRAEVCDAIDNNCNGIVDGGLSCGGTLKDVADYHLSSADQDWRTVSVGPGGYPVWVAGMGGKLAVRRTAGAKFESFSFGDPTTPPADGSLPVHPNNCGSGDWLVSWVNSTGIVFLGGASGGLAIHTGATDYSCAPGGVPSSNNLTGMVGFESGGMTTIYLTDTSGRLYRWNVGGTPAFTELNDNNLNYYGIHGLEENFLLVSGGRTGPSEQRFASYTGVSSGTTASPTAHTANPNNVAGAANAVWMGTASNACAVGDGGAAWRWDGATTWNKVDVPAGVSVDFSSVVMRYDPQNTTNPLNRQFYMVDKSANGKLRRLTPFGWAKGPDLPLPRADRPLRDIAMTQTTGEFWIVGDDGRVFHYPEP
ncbi:putative metal-binding motif-containing protein [Myxococcus eversor]|uniref:putative metal-binding motif-containing protein n=1 Tax=Myxococcus eversor TaxID=2709661 RepID=UPI0013D1BA41|nr:putative metal-binding motif-containing protein [Myxococcus eversor]